MHYTFTNRLVVPANASNNPMIKFIIKNGYIVFYSEKQNYDLLSSICATDKYYKEKNKTHNY